MLHILEHPDEDLLFYRSSINRRAMQCQKTEDAKKSKNQNKKNQRLNGMALTRGKDFLDSQEADGIRSVLKQMTLDSSFNTDSTFSTDSATYADHLIPFVDKHMNYLHAHPKMEASMYLANLKLKTRIR